VNYSIITFGCRVNQADSLEIEQQLLAAGGHPVPASRADVIVVNTCSVTASADQGARQTVRRIAGQNPTAQIVVTGCYATRRPQDFSGLPGVVRVVSNLEKDQVVSAVLTTAERFGDGDGACGGVIEPGLGGRTAYTLRVQTGCDEPCTYCIIPSTRGRGRSRRLEDVLSEVDRVVGAGFREIALTGVHLGSYGRDLAEPTTLTGLLQRLDVRAGDVRYRISSLEPMDCTREVVDLVSRSGRFAPHFHLPLQHASDRLLRDMRRPYGLRAYRRLVDQIRARLPDAAIGSDLIVGFPGETDADTDCLLGYLEGCPLTHLHVFPYSDRPGTAAAAFDGKVDGRAVRERARRVRAAGARLAERFRRSQVNTVRRSLTIDDGSVAVTDNYLKVGIAPGVRRNEWVDVRITGMGEPMEGHIVSNEQRATSNEQRATSSER